ncbi:MAG: hypothetical protein K2X27_26795, partial [Candidatus Obscuribacterales bacterium]|nr:hypothetical protein [Candidatus Obscuribacterales bacterium]
APSLPQATQGLDGSSHTFQADYDLLKNVANVNDDYNIIGKPFKKTCKAGVIMSHDQVQQQAGTGALGCTGRIYFQEVVNNGPMINSGAANPPVLCEPATK